MISGERGTEKYLNADLGSCVFRSSTHGELMTWSSAENFDGTIEDSDDEFRAKDEIDRAQRMKSKQTSGL